MLRVSPFTMVVVDESWLEKQGVQTSKKFLLHLLCLLELGADLCQSPFVFPISCLLIHCANLCCLASEETQGCY